jgi:hypothetical protein
MAHSRIVAGSVGCLLIALVTTGCLNDTQEQPVPEEPANHDINLEAPATLEEGFQLVTPAFEVEPSSEMQDCYFYRVPYDQPVYANRIVLAQNDGSHHLNVFRVKTKTALWAEDGGVVHGGECWKSGNWSEWPLVVNSQNEGAVDWKLPEGVAHKFEPGEMLMVQSHYVNSTLQPTPTVGKVAINFYRTPKEKVTAELGTLFATNQHIRICPGELSKKYEATCKVPDGDSITIIAANGHFHSRGKTFQINTFDPKSGKGEQFYESKSWNDPVFALDLNVKIQPGGGINYACEFKAENKDCGDKTDQCCFNFGGNTDTQEHCNAFVYYYPKRDTDINCF